MALIRAKEASLYKKYLPLAGPVLDVGCGDGFFAKTVFGRVDMGIDLLGSRIGQAKNNGVYKAIQEFDGKRIDLNDKSISTVICNCTLEHVEELKGLVREVFRVLKPRGKLLTTVMARSWKENLVGSLIMGNGYATWMRKRQVHLNLLESKEWDNLFVKSGFSVVKRVGYLSPSACRWLDVMHYLSLPSLVSFWLTDKWVWWPNIIPIKWLMSMVKDNTDPKDSGAIFYELKK